MVAGFQGGAVAEAALTFPHRLAGIMHFQPFCHSCDIAVNPVQQGLPMLICHGSEDPGARVTRHRGGTLQKFGFNPEYVVYPMEHAVCPQQIVDIGGWIERTLKAQGSSECS